MLSRSICLVLLPLVAGVAACQDYKIVPQKEDVIGNLDSAPATFFDTASVATPTSCLLGDSLSLEVATDESCAHEPTTGDLDATVEWSMPSFGDYPEYTQILSTPVVGQLTDDDGDGEITRADTPDIVVIMDDGGQNPTNARGVIRSISGDGSWIHFTVGQLDTETYEIFPYRYSNVALGDINGDGSPEIVFTSQVREAPPEDTSSEDSATPDTDPETGASDSTTEESSDSWSDHPVRPPPPGQVYTSSCHLTAITPDGALMWLATDLDFECGGHAPAIADLDGDGAVEIVLGPYIFAGETGTLVSTGTGGEGRYLYYEETGWISIVSDLDGDGRQEIIAGNTVYDDTGAEICSTGDDDGFSATADLDGDGVGDFVTVGNGTVRTYKADCTPMFAWDVATGGNGGPPTIADFDADGSPEIGVAASTAYAVYEPDGTLLWQADVSDASSHATGSSVADFEADGRPEVVYADESTFWIFDGATGEPRLADTRHSSRTLHEYPVVVDVDGDGSAEIIVPNGGGHYGTEYVGLYVLGSLSNSWYGNRQVWNQHAYNIVNINDDLTVPSPPEPNWPEHNNFRSADPTPVSGGASADAVPEAEVCTEECDLGHVLVYVRVGNQGAADLRSGVPVSLYADFGIGRKLLGTEYTDASVGTGLTSQLITFTVASDDVVNADLLVVVDDEAGVELVPECHEDNNEQELTDVGCH